MIALWIWFDSQCTLHCLNTFIMSISFKCKQQLWKKVSKVNFNLLLVWNKHLTSFIVNELDYYCNDIWVSNRSSRNWWNSTQQLYPVHLQALCQLLANLEVEDGRVRKRGEGRLRAQGYIKLLGKVGGLRRERDEGVLLHFGD